MGRGMGGGAPFPYPKWVWTPTGGWYCNPPNWKRNTALCAVGWAVIMSFVFKVSANNERRPMPSLELGTVPSQAWCKHAVEDDPRLAPPPPNKGWSRGQDE